MTTGKLQTTIRSPQWSDMPELLSLGRRLHAEGWYSHIAFEEDRVATFFCDQILGRDGYFCRVASLGGGISGVIAGAKIRHWFSSQYGAFDNFLYVIPENRGSILAFRLWKEFKEWAHNSGAVELSHGVGTNVTPERADKFFRGMGMTHVGGIYKMLL